MIVVADTSPLLNLARIGRLELLPALFGKVLIPTAVYEELKNSLSDFPQPPNLVSLRWLIVDAPEDRSQVQALRESLDRGEAEAIALTIERQAGLLLIDERRGRAIARAMGLKVTGLLGILARAKRGGLIPSVKPVMDELIAVARFWIGQDLYSEVLKEMGE